MARCGKGLFCCQKKALPIGQLEDVRRQAHGGLFAAGLAIDARGHFTVIHLDIYSVMVYI